jgi:hypothetical protein
VRMRSDAQGRVDLGKLDTIDYFEVSGEDIGEALYEPDPELLEAATEIHQPSGSDIRLPLAQPADAPDRIRLSLLETHNGDIIRDHFEKIAIEDQQLVIRGLAPGTYQLEQRDLTTDILISSGTEHDGLRRRRRKYTAPSRSGKKSASACAATARTPGFPSSACATAMTSGVLEPASILSIRLCPTSSIRDSKAAVI